MASDLARGHKSRHTLEAENEQLRRACTSLYSSLRKLYDAVNAAQITYTTSDGQMVRHKLTELPEVHELDVPTLLLGTRAAEQERSSGGE